MLQNTQIAGQDKQLLREIHYRLGSTSVKDIYNADGTCAGWCQVSRQGVVLVHIPVTPERVTWLCDECWKAYNGQLLLTIPEMPGIVKNKRKEQNEVDKPPLEACICFSQWLRYLFSESKVNSDWSVTIPSKLGKQWFAHSMSPYDDFIESEKQLYRDGIDRMFTPEALEALKATECQENRG